ncbi:adhesion G-protein coupled receptor G7-like isoform X4 [Clavelina lepadiformis]|uniref:adhesion G-protein coupled receptor G7-like isoform X4 n=1 Tax=Clavelina lepadiformis TaxID=159417 RepID=UPI0040414EB3
MISLQPDLKGCCFFIVLLAQSSVQNSGLATAITNTTSYMITNSEIVNCSITSTTSHENTTADLSFYDILMEETSSLKMNSQDASTELTTVYVITLNETTASTVPVSYDDLFVNLTTPANNTESNVSEDSTTDLTTLNTTTQIYTTVNSTSAAYNTEPSVSEDLTTDLTTLNTTTQEYTTVISTSAGQNIANLTTFTATSETNLTATVSSDIDIPTYNTESTTSENSTTDLTTISNLTTSITFSTQAALTEPCDQSCDGCAGCDYNNISECACECIVGYQPTRDGKCDPVFCPQSTVMYPNSSDLINVTFPQTQSGFRNSSAEKCPINTSNSGKPYGTRSCSVNGTWNQPKWLSSCNTTAENYINAIFISTMEQQEAADNLEILTSSPDSLTSNEISLTVEALNNVVNVGTLNDKISSAVVATIGNLLSVSEEDLQQSGQAVSLMQTLDSVGEKVELNDGEIFQEINPAVAVVVVQLTSAEAQGNIGYQFASLRIPKELGLRSDQLSLFFDAPSLTTSSYIQVPPNALQTTLDNRVSFYAFPDDKLFRATDTSNMYSGDEFVASEVILSATVVNATGPVVNLDEPVVMQFFLNSTITSNITLEGKCVFWNETGNGFWSNKSLVSQNISNEFAECRFNHLTNFATLFSTIPVDTPGLDLVTIIGSSISIFSLVLLVATFTFVKKMRTRGKFRSAFLLVNLGMALLILNISLIISEAPSLPTPSTGCTAIAVLIHFSLLSSLAWMMVEGVNIYIVVVHTMYARIHITNRRVIIPSLLWGWLMPAIFVAIVAGVDINNYTRNDSECWLSVDVEIYLIVIPAAVILGINLFFYIAIVARVVCCRRNLTAGQNRTSETRKNVLFSITLFITLGGTWLIAFPISAIQHADDNVSIVFAYIFSVLTALQGFFLFLLYVVRQYFTKDLFKAVARLSFSKSTSTFSNLNTNMRNYQIPRPDIVLERSTATDS